MKKKRYLLYLCFAILFLPSSTYASTANSKKMQKKERKIWKKRKKSMTIEQFREIIEENHKLKTQLLNLNNSSFNEKEEEEYEALKTFSQEFEEMKNKGMILFIEPNQTSSDKEEQSSDAKKNADDTHMLQKKSFIHAHRFQNIKNIEKIFVENLQQASQKNSNTKSKNGQNNIPLYSLLKKQDNPTIDIDKGVVFTVQIGAYRNKNLENIIKNEKNYFTEKNQRFHHTKEKNIHKYTIYYFKKYSNANKFKKMIRAMDIKDAWIVPLKNGKRVHIKEVLPTVIKTK